MTGDQGPGTAGTSRGKRHGTEHTGIHWIQTFRVTFFLGGKGDRGQGTRDRGQREQVEVRDTAPNTLESIGYRPLGLFFVRGGQGTGDQEKDTTFYDLLLSTLWGQDGQDLDALEKE